MTYFEMAVALDVKYLFNSVLIFWKPVSLAKSSMSSDLTESHFLAFYSAPKLSKFKKIHDLPPMTSQGDDVIIKIFLESFYKV